MDKKITKIHDSILLLKIWEIKNVNYSIKYWNNVKNIENIIIFLILGNILIG